VNLVVVCPHFAPDVAPTGAVITRIVEELASRGHRLHVITSLPWYREHRIEPGFEGKWMRREDAPWGTITRLHPFPTRDKTNLFKRAVAFGGFSTLAAAVGARCGPADGVLAMSPPLTLGLSGYAISKTHKAPLVFNVQDIYPDVAVDLGALTNRAVIRGAYRLERLCYDLAAAVTVLSDDLRANVAQKIGGTDRIHVIPNFVDTAWITPGPKENAYRRDHGLDGKTVVMYAGNVGLSQSLHLVIAAARALADRTDVVFVVNGGGAARVSLENEARGLTNIRFVDAQPEERLPEVLSAADLHLVPLKAGLARASVPSKTYSILAAARPLLASVDPGSEVARIVERAGAGVAVPPDDPDAFIAELRRLVDGQDELQRMGERGRNFVESWASPAAVAAAYEDLFRSVSGADRSSDGVPPSMRRNFAKWSRSSGRSDANRGSKSR
jgi:colanic acid biosynthesis glycosyl transferase WcaI